MEKKLNCKTGHRWGGWLQAATLAAGVAVASTAHAQDAGIGVAPGTQSGSVSVINPTRTTELRTIAPTKKQHWISYQDCLDDVELTFRVSVSPSSTLTSLEAYVGVATSAGSIDTPTSCLYDMARKNPALCKLLTVKGNTKNTSTPIIVVTAKQLNALFGIEGCGEGVAVDKTLPIDLQFYFLLEPGANNLGTNDNYAIYNGSGIDLWGPNPPSDLLVTSGDEELQVSFAAGADNSADLIGYRFFVDNGKSGAVAPMTSATSGGTGGATAGVGGSSAVTTGAGGGTPTSAGATTSSASSSTGAGGAGGASTSTGVGGAGGMSTASASSSASTSASGSGVGGAGGSGMNLSTGVTGAGDVDACSATAVVPVCTAASFLLIPGQVPTIKQTGDSLTTGTVGTIADLKNGEALVVAVAAFDEVGNVGKLSELQCATPLPVINILRAYECAGGFKESGCGFCSVGGDRGVSYTALISAGLFIFGFAARRSRRSRVASAARGDR